MNIAEVLLEQARQQPQQLALIDLSRGRARQLSFDELARASGNLATFFKQKSLPPGSAVLVWLPMSLELYVVLIALFRLGLTALFIDPAFGREKISQCCDLIRPAGLVGGLKAQALGWFCRGLRSIPNRFIPGFSFPGIAALAQALPPEGTPLANLTSDAPALITFTSGSTGQPKAIVRTHEFLLNQQAVLQSHLQLPAGQLNLVTLPIFVLSNLAAGINSLIPSADLRKPGRIEPGTLFAEISRYQPASLTASPAFLVRLAEYCQEQEKRLSGVLQIFTGGGPIFPNQIQRLAQMAPQARVTLIYGSTEAEPIAHLKASEITSGDYERMRQGSGLLAGRPIDEIQLAIIANQWGQPVGPLSREAFKATCMPAGRPGEIVVAGRHMIKGYYRGQGDSETKIEVDGEIWHRTSDAGYLDERGRLWLLGRCAAYAADARGSLYPFSVEAAALNFANVRQAALLCHAGRRILFVQPLKKSTLDLNALHTALAWAQLDEIRTIHQIPLDKRHNTKVDYHTLKKLIIKSPNSSV